jgi:hypothetical protein
MIEKDRPATAEADEEGGDGADAQETQSGIVIPLAEVGIMMRVDPEKSEENLNEKNRDRSDADRVEDLLREKERIPPINRAAGGGMSPHLQPERSAPERQASCRPCSPL